MSGALRSPWPMINRIEAVALLIDFLDLLDGDLDLEPEEDCCAAGDDDPASSMACGRLAAMGWPGDPEDAEDEPDLGAAEDEGPQV